MTGLSEFRHDVVPDQTPLPAATLFTGRRGTRGSLCFDSAGGVEPGELLLCSSECPEGPVFAPLLWGSGNHSAPPPARSVARAASPLRTRGVSSGTTRFWDQGRGRWRVERSTDTTAKRSRSCTFDLVLQPHRWTWNEENRP